MVVETVTAGSDLVDGRIEHRVGWIGVAMTGSDTASNVLFGGMQKVAAEQLGLSPDLMGAANSSGGVMGKMIDPSRWPAWWGCT